MLAWLEALMEPQLDYSCIPGKSPSLDRALDLCHLPVGSINGLALLNGSC